MNRHEGDTQKLERHQRAVADLKLDREADEQSLIAIIKEAALRATVDNWPEMPEDERVRLVEEVVGYEPITFQLSIFRQGWSSDPNAKRISLDPEIAGPRILLRAYATAEADTLRLRNEAVPQSVRDERRANLEEKLRRYLPPLD